MMSGRQAVLLLHLATTGVTSRLSSEPHQNESRLPAACTSPQLPQAFANASVLLLGDSLDRNILGDVCSAYNATTFQYLPTSMLNGNVVYNYCRLPTVGGGSFTIANFMHFGNMPELPMYKCAYIASTAACGTGLAATSREHVLQDAPRIREVLPESQPSPTLVVAQSHLWDLAQASQNGHRLETDKWVNESYKYVRLNA